MDGLLGEIRAFAGNAIPDGWMPCNGQIIQIRSNPALYSLLGVQFGGDGRDTFGLPDLRARIPIGQGDVRRNGERARAASESQQIPKEDQGFLALSYCICAQGVFPSRQ